jgi:L-tyrosine isonitrile synthase
MRYDASAPIRTAREHRRPDQSLCVSPPTQRQPASPAKRAGAWTRAVTPEQILRSFNTRAFKREKPDKPELMLQFINQAHARRAPISFVQYWGKGLRPTLAAPEFACLEFLDSMISRIREIYEPGADFTMVFTDTHAALNGHSQASIDSYFEDLVLATRRHRFNICLLSSLIDAAGLRPDEMPERQVPPADLLAELCASAAKWFKGEGSADEGAIRYFQANMVERKVMERAFPRSIFVTFNGSRLRSLFPEALPIFYMFSLRHGISDKPWFLPPDYTGRAPRPNGQSSELLRPAAQLRGDGSAL